MAKGTISKENATKKILEIFPGSFKYDKEIRIPMTEDGEELQLKCVLTCAKTPVVQGGEDAIPGEINFGDAPISQPTVQKTVEVSQEEKDNVKRLMDVLGL